MSGLHPGQLPALIVFTDAVLSRRSFRTRTLMPRHATGAELKVEYAGALLPPEPREAADRPRLLLVLTDLQDLRRRNVDSEADAYMRGGIAEWQKVERFFRDVERENQLILRAAGEGIYGVKIGRAHV